ncbi:hypothetical protein GCM10022235_86170 [Kribbella ginsengisoli]|uniref:Uncharacterized protein n=1 Tax=Kribbella ginsengisoli TaxID=363865 RepID=A0ABP6ZC06_9ACTN
MAGEILPTPADEAAQAVMGWLVEHPSTDAGTVRILRDRETVVVYWKGAPPAELKQVVASQVVPVAIRNAVYSRTELVAAAWALMRANRGVVNSAGPNSDFTAVGFTIRPDAPESAVEAVRAGSAVPVEFRGVEDIRNAGGPDGSGRPVWR